MGGFERMERFEIVEKLHWARLEKDNRESKSRSIYSR
jgi:hypothetical protein